MNKHYNVRVTDKHGMSMLCNVEAPSDADALTAAYSAYSDNWRGLIDEPVEVVCRLDPAYDGE